MAPRSESNVVVNFPTCYFLFVCCHFLSSPPLIILCLLRYVANCLKLCKVFVWFNVRKQRDNTR
jgi:hypothetical protein